MLSMAEAEVTGMAPADVEEEDLSWMRLEDDDAILPKQIRPAPVKRGRGKLILLEDIIKDKKKKLKVGKWTTMGAKRKRSDSVSSSDEEDYLSDDPNQVSKYHELEKLTSFSQLLAEGEREVPVRWGERVFGPQKPFPDLNIPESDPGLISRVLKFKPQEDAGSISTAASMASNGLLLSWAVLERRCDETTVRWLFHQMAYSNNGCVEKGACKVLCDLLRTRDGKPICKLEWLPSFDDIIHTFGVYGYVDACDEDAMQADEPIEKTDFPSQGDTPLVKTGNYEEDGPPSNIRSLLQFLVPYFESRKWYNPLSTSEAEGLVVILIRCQLDRCLLNVANLLRSCFEVLIHYFPEEEWTSSSEHIASAISRISSTFVNNLRVAKSLHATNRRLGSLQKLVVLKLLSSRVGEKISSPEDVVSIIKSVNTKDDNCNFVILHQLLILADIYLWSNTSLTITRKVSAQWLDLLKKCSSQITPQDPRPGATKVRNWASFLSQKYQIEKMQTNVTPQ